MAPLATQLSIGPLSCSSPVGYEKHLPPGGGRRPQVLMTEPNPQASARLVAVARRRTAEGISSTGELGRTSLRRRYGQHTERRDPKQRRARLSPSLGRCNPSFTPLLTIGYWSCPRTTPLKLLAF